MKGQVRCQPGEGITGLLAPQRLHTANGMQDQPNSWHLGPLECGLQASAARAAALV